MKNSLAANNIFFDEKQFPSYKQLKHWFNSCPELVCTLNCEYSLVHVNTSLSRILGYSPGELIGKQALDLVAYGHQKSTLRAIEAIIHGQGSGFENEIIKKDKGLVTISWSCHWDYSERLLFCVGRDITEEKNIELLHAAFERKVKKQNRDMLEMMDRISDGFYAVDSDWRITYVNSSCEQILQVKKEDYLTRVLWDCFPELIGTPLYEGYHKAFKEKKTVVLESFVPSFNAWFEVRVFPSESGVSVFFRNINEQVQMEQERKAYEQRLTEQNHLFNSVLGGMNQGFMAVDKDLRVIYWNKAATEINGIPREKAVGQLLPDLYKQESVQTYGPLIDKAVTTKQSVHDELVCPQTGKWVEIDIYPSGNGLSVFFKDIEERKNAEQKLAKLSLVAQETNDAVSFVELNGRVSWVNNAYTKLTGYSFNEVIGKRSSDLLRGEETNYETERMLREKFYKAQPFEGEILADTKNKGRRWLHATGQPVFDSDGKIVQYFIIQTDITDRKKSEEQIRKLSTYVENSADLIVITDQIGTIKWVNHSFEETTEYTGAEAIGLQCKNLLAGKDTDPDAIAYILSKMKNGEPFQIEILNYSKTGKECWLETYGQPFFDEQGKVTEYFQIKRNVTERKQLEQKLQESRRKQQRLKASAVIKVQEEERALVGKELHDGVNQVLTTVKLYQELIASGTGQQQELALRSANFLQHSIESIRSLSKRLSAPTLGTSKLIDSITELVEGITITKRFDIKTEMSVLESLEVSQEIHLGIYRIMQEHLTNILKHSEASVVQISFKLDDGNLTMKIHDNGKGFNVKEKRKGVGISNMIMRTESIDGKLSINSTQGSGCSLVAVFPVANNQSKETGESPNDKKAN